MTAMPVPACSRRRLPAVVAMRVWLHRQPPQRRLMPMTVAEMTVGETTAENSCPEIPPNSSCGLKTSWGELR